MNKTITCIQIQIQINNNKKGKLFLKVILYSNHCPQCNVLESKLKEKNIIYDEVNDIEVMRSKGFSSIPMLEVDGILMNFKESFNYINALV